MSPAGMQLAADALIEDKEVDAVYIATPPGTHELYAMKVLAAGKPCYVEKPMARNASEARRMVEGFRGKGVPLFVAYYRRALPRFLKVKEILESGVLGKLLTAAYVYSDGQMRQRANPTPWRYLAEESGGGLLLDMGSHAIDLLDFYFGPLKSVSGQAFNDGKLYEVEDCALCCCLSMPVGGDGMRAGGHLPRRKRGSDFFVHGREGREAGTFPVLETEPVRLKLDADGEEFQWSIRLAKSAACGPCR